MKNFKTTMFILAMLIVLTQTIRHLYVRCYYDRPSVLDKYHDTEIDKYIKKSVSLDSLLIKYDKAFNDVKLFEKGKTNKEIDSLKLIDEEIYDTKHSYRSAIEDWEAKENKIHEVVRFWISGIILILFGSFFYYKKKKWFGLTLVITGLVELTYW
jgi:response regulator RpfG family c-di-GMP phosphodiesterase